MQSLDHKESEIIEIDLLLEAIHKKYGYDFRNYSKGSVRRRILHHLSKYNLPSISEIQHQILYDVESFERLLFDLTINVTEMFRDPVFFVTLRQQVIPMLKQSPFIKIWHAGCATGEEVYSMAILLKEEGLYDRTQIYATDIDEIVIRKAKEGIYPIAKMKEYTQNYQKAGGLESFSDYYSAHYGSAIVHSSLKERITFSVHNLTVDRVFGEMDIILCRNVLIYFDKDLQNRVIRLFFDSLCEGGFLCLGSKESMLFSDRKNRFETISDRDRIFRKLN